jgi:hypothetical protein
MEVLSGQDERIIGIVDSEPTWSRCVILFSVDKTGAP